MKSQEQVKNEVKTYVMKTTYGDRNKIDNNTLLLSEGYIDSMGFVSLVAFLNEKFALQMSDGDLVEENFESIDAIVGFVSKKII